MIVVGAAQYRTPDVDWDSERGDMEDYLSAYLADRDSIGTLDSPIPRQAAKDAKYNDLVPGRKYVTGAVRDEDTPDYEELLEESIDVDDLDLDHCDAEGYGDDALDDYREAIEDILAS